MVGKAALASALLLVPAISAYAGHWAYRTTKDAMSSKPVVTAGVLSTNTLDLDFPYGGPQRGFLRISKHPRYGSSVSVTVRKSQMLCRRDDCDLLVRFDDKPPMRFAAAAPADGSINVLFIEDYTGFVSRMLDAKRVWVAIRFYQQGERVLEFDVSGFDQPVLSRGQKAAAAKRAELRARMAREEIAERERIARERAAREEAAKKREAAAYAEARAKQAVIDHTAACIADGERRGLSGDAMTAFLHECDATAPTWEDQVQACDGQTDEIEKIMCEQRLRHCNGASAATACPKL